MHDLVQQRKRTQAATEAAQLAEWSKQHKGRPCARWCTGLLKQQTLCDSTATLNLLRR